MRATFVAAARFRCCMLIFPPGAAVVVVVAFPAFAVAFFSSFCFWHAFRTWKHSLSLIADTHKELEALREWKIYECSRSVNTLELR